VVKALFEHRMLPRVLAGSSVGSIVAGLVATRTDDELRETFRKLDNIELSFFNNSRAVELVHSFLQKGALHDMSFLQVGNTGRTAGYPSTAVAYTIACMSAHAASSVTLQRNNSSNSNSSGPPGSCKGVRLCPLSCCAVLCFLQRKLKTLIGNYTFLEAYERTGRILNVSVCPADTNEPARLLNYLTAPQVRRSAFSFGHSACFLLLWHPSCAG
jgi:hypothetical protein